MSDPNAEMRYQEYEPPTELAPWVKLYWVFECRSHDPLPETIVADGFPELIVHFRSPFVEVDEGKQFRDQPVSVACGQLTKPLVLQSSPDSGMIGIRFQPNGMGPFISTSMESLTDARIAAEDLFDGMDSFISEVMDSAIDRQRVAACNRFLSKSFDVVKDNSNLRKALDRIHRTGGQISVDSLASLAGKSRRSLELAFQKEVGLSPKMYCRITRFRQLFDAVSEEGPSVDWVKMALEAGFFDQSHLIRDFRQFAGDAPTTFLAGQSSFGHLVN